MKIYFHILLELNLILEIYKNGFMSSNQFQNIFMRILEAWRYFYGLKTISIICWILLFFLYSLVQFSQSNNFLFKLFSTPFVSNCRLFQQIQMYNFYDASRHSIYLGVQQNLCIQICHNDLHFEMEGVFLQLVPRTQPQMPFTSPKKYFTQNFFIKSILFTFPKKCLIYNFHEVI